jgi:hypothetical protein
LLLADNERFYLALNRPIDPNQVSGSVVSNNFQSGLRCRLVNGWVLAFDRVVPKEADQLAWISNEPIPNQLVVAEQFDQLPVLLFTGRYNQPRPAGASAWVASTVALHKRTGKAIYESEPRQTLNNFVPNFTTLQIDARQGTINLLGHRDSYSVQFYIDDGRKVDAPAGVARNPTFGTVSALQTETIEFPVMRGPPIGAIRIMRGGAMMPAVPPIAPPAPNR